MALEEIGLDIDSSEWWWQSAEAAREASEKAKESSKKAQAQWKKAQKDEKKAKQWDMRLAGFLVKIIIDPKYDSILNELFSVMDKWYPSQFILWVVSLIHSSLSNTIREISGKEKVVFEYQNSNTYDFDAQDIDPKIQKRIHDWIEDIIDASTIEYSSLLTQRLIKLIQTQNDVQVFTAKILQFFLENINITINQSKSLWVANFILKEALKHIEKLELEEI